MVQEEGFGQVEEGHTTLFYCARAINFKVRHFSLGWRSQEQYCIDCTKSYYTVKAALQKNLRYISCWTRKRNTQPPRKSVSPWSGRPSTFDSSSGGDSSR